MKSQDPPIEILQPIFNLFTNGNFQQALANSRKMLEKFPKSVILCNISGASNTGLMQFDDAIDNYKKALKIKPDYAEAYYNMGIALKKKGDLEGAIVSYKHALEIKPDYAEAYYNMGNALKDKCNFEAAIISYKNALEIKSDFAEAYYNMGIALKKNDDLEAAIDSYKNALKIKPNHAEAYINMGNIHKDKGDLEAAIDSYKKAIEIKSDYSEAKESLVSLMTSYRTQKENSNLIIKVNEEIRKIEIEGNLSRVISDEQVVNLLSKAEDCISSFGLELETKLSQVFRRNSVNLDCERHMSIFDKHDIIPEFCFGCYKVQVEPRTIIDLIKLFIVFDQLELNENNTRKCMVELRPEISGSYKGIIFCSGLKQAQLIANHLDFIIKGSIAPELTSSIKRGCSEYSISYPDYKEINESGPQLMSFNKDWKVFEESHDKKNSLYAEKIIRKSLYGLSLSDILIIRKWIDYAKGIGDPSADLLNQNILYYQHIYDQARTRTDLFNLTSL